MYIELIFIGRSQVLMLLMMSLILTAILGCSPKTLESVAQRQQALAVLEAELGRSAIAKRSAEVRANEKSNETTDADARRANEVTDSMALSSSATSSALMAKIDSTLARELLQRRLSSTTNAAWQIMHGVICYGNELPIETPDQGLVNALDYAFHGGLINGFEIGLGSTPLPQTGQTGITARLEPGSYVGQGHPDQWLAILAMAELPGDTEVMIGDARRTIFDWGRQAQFDVVNNLLNEFSWTLIGLTHYFPAEPTWVTANGTQVSWEALVEVELTNDIDTSACGGTHRLSGLVRALEAKRNLGLADSNVWQEAQSVVDQAIENAKLNRSSDGSLSSEYFVRPSKSVDLGAELSSSGHILEFLALALPVDELSQPWVELSVLRLCDNLQATQQVELDCGALYHALNGLKIYRNRRSLGTSDVESSAVENVTQ